MIEIALYQPEIPPNTGNIIRLCANMGCRLHLIYPLGFSLDEKRLMRAGLDYHDLTHVESHDNFDAFRQSISKPIVACTTKGETRYSDYRFTDQILLFGPETRGLPHHILSDTTLEAAIKIPMQTQARSLNLSNAVAVIAYEAWRQHDFEMLK